MWGISYWILPVISSVVWVGMLISMLVVWCAEGKPHLASMDASQNIAYISDVGATFLKPLFIAGSAVTTVFLDLAFLSERWLRHKGRLAKNYSSREKWLPILSIGFAIIGTAGLILLSIFDTLHHPQLHDIFLLLFIVGYIISAILLCAEYQRLGIHYREHRVLRLSFWVKLIFIIVEVGVAIGFAVCTFTGRYNTAAVLEWLVAFIFTFYVASFIIDLAPAVHSGNYTSKTTKADMEANDDISNARERDHAMNDMNGSRGLTGAHNGDRVNGDAYTGQQTTYTAPQTTSTAPQATYTASASKATPAGHGAGRHVNGVWYPDNVASNF